MGQTEGMQMQLAEAQVRNADRLFPVVLDKMKGRTLEDRTVLAVSGGSGVGKTGMAWLLLQHFARCGIGAIIVSGDHYPHRIPVYNDAERMRIFRTAGLKGLLEHKVYNAGVREILTELQRSGQDANDRLRVQYRWLEIYQDHGDRALEQYLGTEQELGFEELSKLLLAFKDRERELVIRHMGREPHEIWYEWVDVSEAPVLILEWTHGNSRLLTGIDVSVVLTGTPEETLENRKRRNRDAAIDSPFVARVLRIEQKKIDAGLHRADILQDMQGNVQCVKKAEEGE